jgi:hypothetical protein
MKSNTLDVVNAFHTALFSRNVDKAAEFLSDELTVTGFMPHPLRKKAFILGLQTLLDAMPDAKAVLSETLINDTAVTLTFQVSGTFTESINLSALHLSVILPSRKPVVWPAAQWEYTVMNDRITQIQNITLKAGMSGILKAFGIGTSSLLMPV